MRVKYCESRKLVLQKLIRYLGMFGFPIFDSILCTLDGES